MRMKLELWRLRRGFTQEKLAKVSGVSLATISRIEKLGVIPHPSTIQKLATALNVETEELLVEDDEEKPRSMALASRKAS